MKQIWSYFHVQYTVVYLLAIKWYSVLYQLKWTYFEKRTTNLYGFKESNSYEISPMHLARALKFQYVVDKIIWNPMPKNFIQKRYFVCKMASVSKFLGGSVLYGFVHNTKYIHI